MWPAQRVIEASRANGDDEDETKTNGNGREITTVVVVPEQAKLGEMERKIIRDAHSDYHDRYGYV
jgi:hypothetical protein